MSTIKRTPSTRRIKALYEQILRTELTCKFYSISKKSFVFVFRTIEWALQYHSNFICRNGQQNLIAEAPKTTPFWVRKIMICYLWPWLLFEKRQKRIFPIMFMAEKLVLGCWTEEQLCLPEREHWVLPLYLLGRTNKKKPHDKGTIFFCWSTHFSFSFWSTVVHKLEKQKKPINNV